MLKTLKSLILNYAYIVDFPSSFFQLKEFYAPKKPSFKRLNCALK